MVMQKRVPSSTRRSRLTKFSIDKTYLCWREGATREGEQTTEAWIESQPFLELLPSRHGFQRWKIALGEFTAPESPDSFLVHNYFCLADAKLQKIIEKQFGIIRKNSEELGMPKNNFVNLQQI